MFLIWTYNTDKEASNLQLKKKLIELNKVTDGIAKVKKEKLKMLSGTISSSTMLKAALASNHETTITDTLDNLKKNNSLDFILVLKGKSIVYSDSSTQQREMVLKEITSGTFIGAAKVSDYLLLIGKNPTQEDIRRWSEITGSKFILKKKDGTEIIKNYTLPLTQQPKTELMYTTDNNYVIGAQTLLKDSLHITHLYPTEGFKKSFKRKRDKLIVFGLALSFVGLLLSLVVSKLITKTLISSSTNVGSKEFDLLLKEVAELKEKLL